MRTIIAGSRNITDESLVEAAILESGFEITLVVSGCADGVDSIGEEWAKKNSIIIEYHAPDWQSFGKAAGPLRNKKMADRADALICIILDDSKGSTNMIDEATKKGLKIYVKRIYSDKSSKST